jgi:ABC-type Mn2+/Zn2+ transport system permease subunit
VTRQRRELAIIFALVVVYFAGMTGLALAVDRRFFFNDAVSAAAWVVIAVAALSGALATRRR